jgi:hypothetical protein
MITVARPPHSSQSTHARVVGRLERWAILAVVAMSVALTCGCNSKSTSAQPEAAVLQAAQALPDGTNVLALLDQKDYEGTIAGLAKIKEGVTEGESRSRYLLLKQFVVNKLQEAALSDPKATEALNAVRLISSGR